jgi:hypothetical protein
MSSIPDLYHGINFEVLGILYDITGFAQSLDRIQQSTRLDPLDYTESVLLRMHRLLHYAPLEHRRLIDPLDNLVHMSLIATMTTLMPEYNAHSKYNYNLLAIRFRSALQTYAATTERNNGIFLWALFVGFASILDHSVHGCLASMVGELCVLLGLHSWADVRFILNQYPWISILYDTSGLKLWNMIEGADWNTKIGPCPYSSF